ncbi:MAG: hypothetical protein Q9200_003074 [Gallowayella weberi]
MSSTAELIRRQMFISWMTLYGASITTAKIAILLLYIRVFTTELRRFTLAVTVIGTFIVATGITTIVGSVLQCMPIAYNWDKTTPGRCINEVNFARYMAIANIITGFAMLILPLPMVWRLNINVPQKIALTATFLHGIMFVLPVLQMSRLSWLKMRTVASLQALLDLPSSAKQPKPRTRTHLVMAISWTIWTIIEPANYVIVACLPTLRPILMRILPAKFFLTYRSHSSRPYSIVNISWPKGRASGSPKSSVALANINGAKQMMTGPWDGPRAGGPPDLEANGLRMHGDNLGELTAVEAARDIKPPGGRADDEYPPLPAFGGLRHQRNTSRAARIPENRVDSGVGF